MKFPNETVNPNPMVCQTSCGYFDDVRKINGFVDLRPFEDDKTVLKNPHKGWYWHFIDNGYRHGAYRDRVKKGEYMEEFPGMNHLYLRFDWSDAEAAEDVYDFRFLDDIMDEWSQHGYKFALNVCCYECALDMQFATPKYLFEKGMRCYTIPDRSIQPDYSDPYFLERLEKFLSKVGEKYNNDDRIEYVIVGTYGTWGEGHTVEGDGTIYPLETVLKHISLNLKYFPDKYVMINDDHVVSRIEKGDCQAVLDYAYERGLGVQDDSICCDYYSVVNGYDTMRADWAFKKLYKNAPTSIEFAHYSYIHPTYDHFYRNGLTIVECLKNSHATFAGFHGYPELFLQSDKYLAEYCANRLGYWYFVPSAVVPELTASAHNIVSVTFENRGWAKAYHPHRLKFRISGEGFEKIIDTDKYIDRIDSNEIENISVNLDLRDVPAGEYDISIAVFCNDTPVKLALKEDIKRGDFYTISKRTVKAI